LVPEMKYPMRSGLMHLGESHAMLTFVSVRSKESKLLNYIKPH